MLRKISKDDQPTFFRTRCTCRSTLQFWINQVKTSQLSTAKWEIIKWQTI